MIKCPLSLLTADSQIQSFKDIHLIKTFADKYQQVFVREILEKTLVLVGDPTWQSELDGFKLIKKTLQTSRFLRLAMVTKSFSKKEKLDPDSIMASLHDIDLVVLDFDQPRDLTNDVHYVGDPFWGRCECTRGAIKRFFSNMQETFETRTRKNYRLICELTAMKNSASFCGDVIAQSHLDMYCEEMKKFVEESHQGHKRLLAISGSQQPPSPPPRNVSMKSEMTYMTMKPQENEMFDLGQEKLYDVPNCNVESIV